MVETKKAISTPNHFKCMNIISKIGVVRYIFRCYFFLLVLLIIVIRIYIYTSNVCLCIWCCLRGFCNIIIRFLFCFFCSLLYSYVLLSFFIRLVLFLRAILKRSGREK